MTRKEAIELINTSDNCYSLRDAKNLLRDCKYIKRQDYDDYRWHIMATDIYEAEDGYIGVSGVFKLKSEEISFSDCDKRCIAEEYDAIPTITYIPKNN